MLKQLRKWREVRQTCRMLEAKSDRLLADMGIERENIPMIARGLAPTDHDARRSIAGHWFADTARYLAARREKTEQQRRIQRELSAYRDTELAEIGVRRVDIRAIARGDMPAHAA